MGLLCVRGGTLIDGTGGNPVSNATILIENERIKDVGPSTAFSVPAGAQTIDASGKYILPGFIDSHVHYRNWMPELFLHHGVTTIKDTGNILEWIFAQRDGVNKGKIPGPRIFVAGQTGSVAGFKPDIDPEGAFPPRRAVIATTDDAHRIVRGLVARGVHQIKVMYGFGPELLAALSDEAHKGGIKATGHITISARDAIASGLDCLEHGTGIVQALVDKEVMNRVYELSEVERRTTCAFHLIKKERISDFVDFLVERGAHIVPNFTLLGVAASKRRAEYEGEALALLKDPNLTYIPQGRFFWWLMDNQHFWIDRASLGSMDNEAERLRNLQEGYRCYQEIIALFAQRGGRIITGTDTGFCVPGLSLHHELQETVDAGISPMKAIVSATSAAAKFLGGDVDEVGVVAKGKFADLVIIEGNPLENIRNTQNIVTVIKDGKILDTAFHLDFNNPLPSPRMLEPHGYRVPEIVDMEPYWATEGDGPIEISIKGKRFARQATAKFAGQRIKTIYKGPTELLAVIPARLLSQAGTFPVTVVNPPPDGGDSQPVHFMNRFA